MGSSEVLLAVKVGNSNSEMGLFDGTELLASWTIATRRPSTADEIECSVRCLMDVRDLPLPDRAILCSVVPSLTTAWTEALGRIGESRALVVGPGLKSGIAMKYKDPGQVGADRVALSLAARELEGAPVIAIDCGSTTSISVVDETGVFLGGAIAPGIGLSLDALSDGAAQIADVESRLPKAAIGRTTFDAVRSGVVFGEAARLEGLVRAMWDELGYSTKLVAAGSYSGLVCAASRLEIAERPDLALQGLRLIFDLNRK